MMIDASKVLDVFGHEASIDVPISDEALELLGDDESFLKTLAAENKEAIADLIVEYRRSLPEAVLDTSAVLAIGISLSVGENPTHARIIAEWLPNVETIILLGGVRDGEHYPTDGLDDFSPFDSVLIPEDPEDPDSPLTRWRLSGWSTTFGLFAFSQIEEKTYDPEPESSDVEQETMVDFSWPNERPYNARVTKVVDGDTIKCDIDLGLRSSMSGYRIRLKDLNAAEISTEGGKAAKENLEALLPIGTSVVLTTVKDYKYGGEFVATVWLGNQNINQKLIDEGWAAAWDGKGIRPVPVWPREESGL